MHSSKCRCAMIFNLSNIIQSYLVINNSSLLFFNMNILIYRPLLMNCVFDLLDTFASQLNLVYFIIGIIFSYQTVTGFSIHVKIYLQLYASFISLLMSSCKSLLYEGTSRINLEKHQQWCWHSTPMQSPEPLKKIVLISIKAINTEIWEKSTRRQLSLLSLFHSQ